MTIHDHKALRPALRRAAAASAAMLLAACAGPAPAPEPAPVETSGDGLSFTITEPVDVSPEVRYEFDSAVRLMEQERYEEGIALLNRVVAAAPDITAAHIDLGIAHRRLGELERAEESLLRARTLNPRHPVVHNELGMLYRMTGRFPEARASYEQALALQPAFHYARRNLAILCDVYLADLSCALANYEVYVEAVPEDEEAAMWVADIRNRAGQ